MSLDENHSLYLKQKEWKRPYYLEKWPKSFWNMTVVWKKRKHSCVIQNDQCANLPYNTFFFLESLRVDFLSHIHHIRSKCQRFKRNMANSMSCIPKRKVDSSVMWFYFPSIIIVLYPITFWQFYSGLMQTNQWKYYCQ